MMLKLTAHTTVKIKTKNILAVEIKPQLNIVKHAVPGIGYIIRVVGQKGSIYPSKHYSLLPRLLVTFYNTGSQPVCRDALGEEVK